MADLEAHHAAPVVDAELPAGASRGGRPSRACRPELTRFRAATNRDAAFAKGCSRGYRRAPPPDELVEARERLGLAVGVEDLVARDAAVGAEDAEPQELRSRRRRRSRGRCPWSSSAAGTRRASRREHVVDARRRSSSASSSSMREAAQQRVGAAARRRSRRCGGRRTRRRGRAPRVAIEVERARPGRDRARRRRGARRARGRRGAARRSARRGGRRRRRGGRRRRLRRAAQQPALVDLEQRRSRRSRCVRTCEALRVEPVDASDVREPAPARRRAPRASSRR